MGSVPRYHELPTVEGTGERHCWDVFGRDDQLGTVNFSTPDTVAAAAHEVRDGRVVCLSIPLNLPYPALPPGRTPYAHEISRSRMGRDDSVSQFYLQCSSQWDGLAHIRFREFGYYGGRDEADLEAGALGVDVLARHGIVGRGVLVDVQRYARHTGLAFDPTQRVVIGPGLLDQTLAFQRTEVRPGDILLLRTGWLGWYLNLDAVGRRGLEGRQHGGPDGLACPGLAAGTDVAAWLWDHRVSAVAADNPALEALPVRREEGFLHRRILALLGMPIGELFALDELAGACADVRRWSFLFTSAPLHLPSGVGSPNNAYALL